jgi:hypothetical protein
MVKWVSRGEVTVENSVGKVLRVIGLVQIAAGLIIGLVWGGSNDPSGESFNFSVFISCTATGFISGILFIGFAEIIHLLQKIYNQLQGLPTIKMAAGPEPGEPSTDTGSTQEINMGEPVELNDLDKEKVLALYNNQKLADILPTPYEGYCIVQFSNRDEISIVDVGGFKAVESKDIEMNQKIKQWYEQI